MDLSCLAQQASDLIEHIAERYGEGTEIRTLMLLIEVNRPTGDGTDLISRCSDDRPWVQIAFMDEHHLIIEEERDAALEVAEDEDD